MDQASRLRKIITDRNATEKRNNISGKGNKKNTRIICVTSGKGGVGKTNFTANLAINLSKRGKKVVVIDADLGLANVDVVLGVIPRYNLLDVIKKGKDITEIMNQGADGVKLISGGSGIIDLVDMPKERLQVLINQFDKLYNHAEIILIDTGAGLTKSVLSFAHASDEIVVITTPEPTSLTDAYAMIKHLWSKENDKKIRIVINRVDNLKEGKVAFEKLRSVCDRFLDFKIYSLGYLPNDKNVGKAVRLQKPFVVEYPNTIASKNIDIMAANLIDKKLNTKDVIYADNFINKVISLFR